MFFNMSGKIPSGPAIEHHYVLASHRSHSIFCHVYWGNGVLFRGSFRWVDRRSWQCPQRFTKSFISVDNPGHHIDRLASSRHCVTPWWPSWIFRRISALIDAGIELFSLRTKSPYSLTVSSSLTTNNSRVSPSMSLACLGQPETV